MGKSLVLSNEVKDLAQGLEAALNLIRSGN